MIDCHCHLSFLSDDEVRSVVSCAPSYKQWIMGGYEPKEWKRQVQIKLQYPKQIMASVGLHPWFVNSSQFEFQRALEDFAIYWPQAEWVGEVGLDYSKGKNQRDLQVQVLKEQLQRVGDAKPLVLHVVQAHSDMLEVLKQGKYTGFVHGFSGSAEVAQQYRSAGFLLSIGPGILKSHYKKMRSAVESLPLDALLIESDSPGDLSESSRNETNKIYNLVLKEVALIKKVDVNTLQEQVIKNIKGLLSG